MKFQAQFVVLRWLRIGVSLSLSADVSSYRRLIKKPERMRGAIRALVSRLENAIKYGSAQVKQKKHFFVPLRLLIFTISGPSIEFWHKK